MEKRYQVFVSSTYEDLIDERREVMQALLELDCMPSGMELFPATNDDQWTLIKNVIDDCDYYIVIIGGRYGSIGSSGISYTQMEYDYAIAQSKPVIAFLHKDPSSIATRKAERSQDGREKLEAFREKAQQKMCKYWSSPAELGSVVSRSLVKLIKTHPAIGWVKADVVPDESAAQEILKLRKRIEELERDLFEATTEAPQGTEMLAQGDDEFVVKFYYSVYTRTNKEVERNSSTFETTWNKVFSRLLPLMIDEANEESLKAEINKYIQLRNSKSMELDGKTRVVKLGGFAIDNRYFQTIKIQLKALNLITKSKKHKSVKDQATYWTLTPYGESVMTRLRAIHRSTEPA